MTIDIRIHNAGDRTKRVPPPRDYRNRKSTRGTRRHLTKAEVLQVERGFLDGKPASEVARSIGCGWRSIYKRYARLRSGETYLAPDLVVAVLRVVAKRKPHFYKSDFVPS